MKVIGLSAYYHDSAAALVCDGQVVAAAQEERFTRKKNDARFPHFALKFCLDSQQLKLSDIDAVVFYDKPLLKFERLVETYLATAPKGFNSFRHAMPTWITEKLFQKNLIGKELSKHGAFQKEVLFSEHHLSHGASAFYPSPFERAAILTMDGVGEWTTTSQGIGFDNKVHIQKEIHFPHSLGLLYSAFTFYTGFKVNSGEYKLMGLAPYGTPKFSKTIRDNLIDIKTDGSFRLNLKYFGYLTEMKMTNRHFHTLFGGAPRHPDEPITARHMDLAASIQEVTEEVILKMARCLKNDTGEKNLCLAGGVALNCVANGKLLKENVFEKIWVQPAAGDAGGALGAAMAVSHAKFNQPRKSGFDSMRGGLLGPSFSDETIRSELSSLGAKFHMLSNEEMVRASVKVMVEGGALGWFQGAMEFGPRALGSRSILADPRSETMQSILNLKIKFRESFRPFAPSILREDVSDWFELSADSPYMLFVAPVKKEKRSLPPAGAEELFGIDKLRVPRSLVPAVTHVDYSARIQTVDSQTHPLYHRLITEFKKSTGCPMLVNTSFNVRGEPIVLSPLDAWRCFMGTNLDALAIGNSIVYKNEQDPSLLKQYKNGFELD